MESPYTTDVLVIGAGAAGLRAALAARRQGASVVVVAKGAGSSPYLGGIKEAIYAAKLLTGEMPADIEDVFAAAGVSLFPDNSKDLETSCSCPDWANPCKHVAAVYYLLGERFDADPFLIFAVRGRSKEQIIDVLRARRSSGAASATSRR